jgi:hypothetical protein
MDAFDRNPGGAACPAALVLHRGVAHPQSVTLRYKSLSA